MQWKICYTSSERLTGPRGNWFIPITQGFKIQRRRLDEGLEDIYAPGKITITPRKEEVEAAPEKVTKRLTAMLHIKVTPSSKTGAYAKK